MTKLQKKELIEVLKNDCALEGKYKRGGKTCAIGALVMAAARRSDAIVALASIEGRCIDPMYPGPDEHLEAVHKWITDKFGITVTQMGDIQEANDSIRGRGKEDVSLRRMKVLASVRKFKVSRK